MLHAFTANLAGKTRRAFKDGREYIVAPLTLIVPGVLNGSKGPLYYPPEEVARNSEAWDEMPIVVYHPRVSSGEHVSAQSPGILEKQGIGIVRKPLFNGKLTAEGWFDSEKTRAVDQRVYSSLLKNEPIELSTGLYTDNEPAENGSTAPDGRSYMFIARNYKPDHLAILPDQTGACSLRDGCGVLINMSQATDNAYNPSQPRDSDGKWGSGGGSGGASGGKGASKAHGAAQAGAGAGKSADAELKSGGGEETAPKESAKSAKARHKEAVKGALGEYQKTIQPAQEKYNKIEQAAMEKYEKTVKSAGDKYNKIASRAPLEHPAKAEYDEKVRKPALAEYVAVKTPAWEEYKKVERPAWADFQKVEQPAREKYNKVEQEAIASGYYRKTPNVFNRQAFYKVTGPDGKTKKLSTDEIRKLLTDNQSLENHRRWNMTLDAREGIVDRLIENSCCWDEDDREELMELTDNQLLKLNESMTKELQAEAVVNAAREGFGLGNEITVNEMPAFIKEKIAKKKAADNPEEEEDEDMAEEKPAQNAASPTLTREQMEDIAFARSIKQERKDVAINAITANANNRFTKDQLNGMPLDTLQAMADLAKVAPVTENRPSYLGASVPPTANLSKEDENDFLPLPSVDWGSKSA